MKKQSVHVITYCILLLITGLFWVGNAVHAENEGSKTLQNKELVSSEAKNDLDVKKVVFDHIEHCY